MGLGAKLLQLDGAALLILSECGGTVEALSWVWVVAAKSLELIK